MSLFNPTIPTGLVKLSLDYKNVQNNFAQLDTSFSIDHYAFSDQTSNNGFHNKTTMPLIVGSVHPTTSATNTVMYCMQDSANLGLLNYSRGPSNAVPTPLTSLHSSATGFTMTGGQTINIFDATGLSIVFATLIALGKKGTSNPRMVVDAFFNGTNWFTGNNSMPNTDFSAPVSGKILQLNNTNASTSLTNVFWTLKFERIQ